MVFCGLDIGTTNTKAVLLDADGELLDRVSITAESLTDTAKPSTTWYNHFCRAMDYFSSRSHFADRRIVCSVTAQGGSFLLLNENFQPVSREYNWTELAGEKVRRDLSNCFDELRYYHTTGWQLNPWLAACKLKELLAEDKFPSDARFVASAPDFIYAQMVNKPVTDITNAQILGLCDFQKARWSPEILKAIGLKNEFLPPIVTESKVLFDRVPGKWGQITFVTGSHDQYAAMQAANLEKDKGPMLGTGTAWVINIRTAEPVFDDENFLIHPGKDLCKNCFGNIVTLGQIGRGFDKLLDQLGLDKNSLDAIEKKAGKNEPPRKTIDVDVLQGSINCEPESDMAIRRYMEWAGSKVAFMLDKFNLAENIDKIIMSGGAVSSRLWPQVVADLCNVTVEAVDFPEFTAYGAALHARAAVSGHNNRTPLIEWAKSRTYEPLYAADYRQWYLTCQQPLFADSLLKK